MQAREIPDWATDPICYHCSGPVDGQYIHDDGAVYHPACYATAMARESCAECGGLGPDAFVISTGKNGGHILPVHSACAKSRSRRLAFR
jgi:hypothetical protein